MVLRGALGRRIGRIRMDRRGISAIEFAVLGSISAVLILGVAAAIAGAIERVLPAALN
jgi:Flp pilus assembly pilin Flp